MKTRVLPISSPSALSRAVEILNSGGLVAFPTDTVYGLGALAWNGTAVESMYIVKDRPSEKAIPILLAEIEDLPKVALSVPEMAMTLAASFWPGPLTLVIPKRPDLPEAISSGPTIAVRIPRHSEIQRLLSATGPLAVTSANRSNQPSPVTAKQVEEQLGGLIALILDGGQTPAGIPSTVVDCTGLEPKILREGPISRFKIAQSLGLG